MTAYYRDTPTGEIQRVDWLPVSDDGTWALATLSSIGSTNRHNVVASRYARGGWVSGYGVVGNARIRATGAPGVARPSIQLTYFPAVSFATSAACRVSNGGSGEVALLAPDAIGPATTEVVTATHEFSSFPAWIESFSPTLPTGQVYQIEYTNARVYRDITRHLPGGIRPFTWADFTTISDAIDAFPLNIVQDHVLFEATNAVRRGYAEFDGRWTTDQVFAFDGLSLVDLPESEVGAAGESAVAFGPAGYPYAEGFVRLSSPLVEVSTNKEGEVSFSTNYAVLTHKTLSVSIHAPASLVWCIDPGDVMRITNVWTNAALTLRGRWAVYAPCEAGGSDISAFAAPPLQQGAFEVAGTNVSAGADFSSWGEILLGELETSPTNWIAEQWRVDGGTTNVTSWVQHVRAHRLLRGRGVLHVERANPPGGGRGLSADRSRTPREEELRSRGIVR